MSDRVLWLVIEALVGVGGTVFVGGLIYLARASARFELDDQRDNEEGAYGG